jgi:hypothetical protein
MVGIVTLLGGIYLLAKPMVAVNFYVSRASPTPRVVKDTAIPRLTMMARVTGVVAIIASISAFGVWFRSL